MSEIVRATWDRYETAGQKQYDIVSLSSTSGTGFVIRRWGKVGTKGAMLIARFAVGKDGGGSIAMSSSVFKIAQERIKHGYEEVGTKSTVFNSVDNLNSFLRMAIGEHLHDMTGEIELLMGLSEMEEPALTVLAPPVSEVEQVKSGEGYESETWGAW